MSKTAARTAPTTPDSGPADPPATPTSADGVAETEAPPKSPRRRTSAAPGPGTDRRPAATTKGRSTARATARRAVATPPGTDPEPTRPKTTRPAPPAATEHTSTTAARASATHGADTDADAVAGDATPPTPPPTVTTVDDAVQDRVWKTLRGHPGATSSELAQHSKIARATIAKLLEAWVEEGSVTAATGPKPRSASRWTAVPLSTTLDPTDPSAIAAQHAPAPGVAHTCQPDEAESPSPETTGPASVHTPSAKTTSARRLSSMNRSGSERLMPGGLKGLVEDFLTEHPGDHGPTAISHAIGRSQGAIANALERLVDTGWAQRTSDKPKRYRIATITDADGSTTDLADSAAPTVSTDGNGTIRDTAASVPAEVSLAASPTAEAATNDSAEAT